MAQSSEVARGIPPGLYFIRWFRCKDWSFTSYRYAVLLITFIAYTCYHASRKPTSIVKSVLDSESNESKMSNIWPMGTVFVKKELVGADASILKGGWAPFDGKDGTSMLGEIDVAFLACYSMGMYVAGHLGDRMDLRLFLTTGMIGSGIFVALFGMGYFWNIHAFWFFLVTQMIAGLFQATGWPSVVAVIGNWFGKRKRGLIMGIWNAHTSVGNITGSLLATSVLEYGWGWSFILPGVLIILGGILVYSFLAAYPEDVGFPCPHSSVESKGAGPSVPEEKGHSNVVLRSSAAKRSVGLLEACLIPGVIPFALCLFFSKLVAYTFLYWLPFYLSKTEIGGEFVSVKSAGNLSTLFDVGGMVGGIVAGHLSDKLNARATIAATFMYAAIPSMILYRHFGSISMTMNIVFMMIVGLFVNGPYALITTSVSADLGTHRSLKGDSRALATVTAIIDGTGSLGAALGPLLTGFLSTKGWDKVFLMLMVGAFIAGLLLSRLVISEITNMFKRKHSANGPHNGGPESQPLLSEER